MKPFTRIFLISTLLSATMVGCTQTPSNVYLKKPSVPAVADETIVHKSYKIADHLMKQSNVYVDPERPIVVASFANIDNLSSSSTFGRMISQKISSRFTQQGYQVVELLMRKDIYIKQQKGEFLLSRALKNISLEHNAQSVIVGTYAVAKNAVYVTAKVVRTKDNVVLASNDFALPMTDDVKMLLK